MKRKLLILLFLPFLSFGQVQIGQDIVGDIVGDRLGRDVSISSDGNIIAIGETQDEGNSSNFGQVQIYENQSGIWTQIGQDINGEAEDDDFGFSVSLSSDGTVVAIGAIRNDTNGEDSGKVQVYENQSGIWIQLGQDIVGDAAEDNFGSALDISSDGSFLAIGSTQNDGNGNNSGQVKIYQIQGNIWSQIGEDIFGENPGDRCGRSVSFSSDANKIAISSFFYNGVQERVGHVRIFEFIDDIWTQVGQDIEGESFNDQSGDSIGLSSDGNIVAIGASINDGNGLISGHVRIYENIDNVWMQIGEDIDGENQGDLSGKVSLSSNGTIVAIGAPFNSENGNVSGHVRIYENQSGTWTQIGNDIDGEAQGILFGDAVSLSSDGSVVVIGGIGFEDSTGLVRVFDLSALLSIEEVTQSQFTIYPNPASTNVTIQLNPNSNLEKATIYNSLGQIVKTSTVATIDTSNLLKGMYILEVITNQGKASKKLMIN